MDDQKAKETKAGIIVLTVIITIIGVAVAYGVFWLLIAGKEMQ